LNLTRKGAAVAQAGIASIEGFEQIFAGLLQSVELRNEGRWAEALACLEAAIAINPQLPLCQLDRARALCALQRHDEAIESLDAFSGRALRSAEVEALKAEIREAGLSALRQRLSEQPDDPAARLQRGNLFRLSGHHPEALADYAAILERQPEHVAACTQQAAVFVAQGRYAEAVAAYTRALRQRPECAELWYNLGNVRQLLGRFDAARQTYQRAIACRPDFAEARMEIAQCWLAEGNYAAGWPLYEWRWRTGQMQSGYLPGMQPLWLGGYAPPECLRAGRPVADAAYCLAGKTLLVWAEQGLGDTLQFVRFVPALLAQAGQVILRVQAALRHLLEGFDARIRVVGDDQALPPHDVHCPLLSLPLALGLEHVPHALHSSPYLRADSAHGARWQKLLGPKDRLRVGIAWAGRQSAVPNHSRDLPLAVLAPLAAIDADWISLQKERPASDAAAHDALPGLFCYAALLNDMADTAALIESLDLVISADTAVAHLAGALGKPCWLMLRYSSEWRWLRERRDSPWYPGMRLFRQPAPGDWAAVIAEIRNELRAVMRSERPRAMRAAQESAWSTG
jgi:tetratricopeptide (TPR) repeat protein